MSWDSIIRLAPGVNKECPTDIVLEALLLSVHLDEQKENSDMGENIVQGRSSISKRFMDIINPFTVIQKPGEEGNISYHLCSGLISLTSFHSKNFGSDKVLLLNLSPHDCHALGLEMAVVKSNH